LSLPIHVHRAFIKPDLKCGDAYFEIEREDEAHYGLGQALAYRHGGRRVGLMIIVVNRYNEIVEFLRWVRSNFDLITKVVICRDNDREVTDT
jgi:hypothetical protein